MRIGLLGASGFVGSAVRRALLDDGHEVVVAPAPRLVTTARSIDEIAAEAACANLPAELAAFDSCAAVINAAGLAVPGEGATDSLFGANGLLPALLARALSVRPGRRLVHVSSAAVHGAARLLDERLPVQPTTPYGRSKLIGELAATQAGDGTVSLVLYRPTSVHGISRPLTRSLVRFSRSPLSSVAGEGRMPTPQVLVENVAATAVFLATCDRTPTSPVLHPWEDLTTGDLLTGLGGGREPHHVPGPVARATVSTALRLGLLHPSIKAHARRLEMLWLGQAQVPGWLAAHGPAPVRTWPEAFADLAAGTHAGDCA